MIGAADHDRFDRKLEELLDEMSGAELLAVPGLYEVVSEALNNEVLRALEREDAERRAESTQERLRLLQLEAAAEPEDEEDDGG